MSRRRPLSLLAPAALLAACGASRAATTPPREVPVLGVCRALPREPVFGLEVPAPLARAAHALEPDAPLEAVLVELSVERTFGGTARAELGLDGEATTLAEWRLVTIGGATPDLSSALAEPFRHLGYEYAVIDGEMWRAFPERGQLGCYVDGRIDLATFAATFGVALPPRIARFLDAAYAGGAITSIGAAGVSGGLTSLEIYSSATPAIDAAFDVLATEGFEPRERDPGRRTLVHPDPCESVDLAVHERSGTARVFWTRMCPYR